MVSGAIHHFLFNKICLGESPFYRTPGFRAYFNQNKGVISGKTFLILLKSGILAMAISLGGVGDGDEG